MIQDKTGDKTFFTRWDNNKVVWKILDTIIKQVQKTKKIYLYLVGSWDPKEEAKFLEKDSRNLVISSGVYHEYH